MTGPLDVHRCRFVDWVPESITAMTFNSDGTRVACAREGGDIEVWSIAKRWIKEFTLYGSRGAYARALVWIEEEAEDESAKGRCSILSAGFDGFITEWDVHTQRVKAVADAFGGAIWSMAISHEHNIVAVGTEDGSTRAFDASVSGVLEYVRSMDKQDGRVLSVGFGERNGRLSLVTGSADGLIRVYDYETGRALLRIQVESYGNTQTCVWSLVVLPDFSIVSGDSLGHTQFWDGMTGALNQTFNSHEADVLAMSMTKDGRRVFSSGIDGNVIMFQPVEDENGDSSWVLSGSQRVHTHDVRALAVASSSSADASVDDPLSGLLISGGVDTQMVVYPISRFSAKRPLKITPFPGGECVSLAKKQRAFLFKHNDRLELWKLGTAGAEKRVEDGQRLALDEPTTKLATIQPSLTSSIISSAISPDGEFVFFSDAARPRLLHLSYSEEGRVEFTKVPLPEQIEGGCRGVFTSGSRTLILASELGALVFIVIQETEHEDGTDAIETRVARVYSRATGETAEFEEYEEDADDDTSPVVSMAVSEDGQWLACGTADNAIAIYNLDSMRFHCNVPALDAYHSCLRFHPLSSTLVVGCVSNNFYLFDVERRRLADWSKDQSSNVPEALLRMKGGLRGMAFNVARPSTIMLYSNAAMCYIDLNKKRKKSTGDAAKSSVVAFGGPDSQTEEAGFKVIEKFKPLIFMDFVGPDEMIVVERPWLDVITSFPDPFYRKKYGT